MLFKKYYCNSLLRTILHFKELMFFFFADNSIEAIFLLFCKNYSQHIFGHIYNAVFEILFPEQISNDKCNNIFQLKEFVYFW